MDEMEEFFFDFARGLLKLEVTELFSQCTEHTPENFGVSAWRKCVQDKNDLGFLIPKI